MAAGVYITAMGLISPWGVDVSQNLRALRKQKSALAGLMLFPTPCHIPLPVGEIGTVIQQSDLPRCHLIARLAAEEAMTGILDAPDAVVIGGTTGGMLKTETLLQASKRQSDFFKWHSTGSVARYIASLVGCKGPVITVSTACSSGAAAIKLAMEMLRQGEARRVLAGGADSLCRLTYYGFNALQLIDSDGARPFDHRRKGMSVAEGAGMLLLSTDPSDTVTDQVAILGGGLSCDAYHPTAPHPEGLGAEAAMLSALNDAGLSPAEIDYINLHGTGTIDNDRSEAAAIKALFGDQVPPLSSIKGATGHSLAASGAIEAVISALCITHGLIPCNTGLQNVDPKLGIKPQGTLRQAPLRSVLSNAFGFGGNNASLSIGIPRRKTADKAKPRLKWLTVTGTACITGSGFDSASKARLAQGRSCRGIFPTEKVCAELSPRKIRRLKRLPRLALALAFAARKDADTSLTPEAVFFGTGWGPLSETHAFLKTLFDSGERFAGPTDFVGSVHNAPAGQVALEYGSTGANITTTGEDWSFEQALYSSALLAHECSAPLLVMGADEYHPVFSNLFDPSVEQVQKPADGGGALWIDQHPDPTGIGISPLLMGNWTQDADPITRLIDRLGGADRIRANFGLLLVGIPRSQRQIGIEQLDHFLKRVHFKAPVIHYRRFTGEFASASAIAAVWAVEGVRRGTLPLAFAPLADATLYPKGVLVLGLGETISAMAILKNAAIEKSYC